MAKHYNQFQPRQKEVRYKNQKKCGHCKEIFTFPPKTGKRRYCDECQRKLKIPVWDNEKKMPVSRQTSLIEEDEKETLMRGDLE